MATSIEGVDYSFDRPSLPTLYAMGKRFCCRYIGGGSSSKLLTLSEAAWLTVTSLDIVSGFESTRGRADSDEFSGIVDAELAAAAALKVGMPPGRPIYFAVDIDASPAQLVNVANYFRGVAAHIGLAATGVYGGYRTLAYLHSRGLVRWMWQTYAWSGGKVYPGTHIYQYSNGHKVGSASVDYDRALRPDFGQWRVSSTFVPPPPITFPPSTTETPYDYSATVYSQGNVFSSVGVQMSQYAAAFNALIR